MYDVAVKQKFGKAWFDDDDDDGVEQKHNDGCYDMEYTEFVKLFENKMKRLCGLTIDVFVVNGIE